MSVPKLPLRRPPLAEPRSQDLPVLLPLAKAAPLTKQAMPPKAKAKPAPALAKAKAVAGPQRRGKPDKPPKKGATPKEDIDVDEKAKHMNAKYFAKIEAAYEYLLTECDEFQTIVREDR